MDKIKCEIFRKETEIKEKNILFCINIGSFVVCLAYLIIYYILPCSQSSNILTLFKDIDVSILSAAIVFFLSVSIVDACKKGSSIKALSMFKKDVDESIINLISLVTKNKDWQEKSNDTLRKTLSERQRDIFTERASIIYTNSEGKREAMPLTINAIKTYLTSIETQLNYLIATYGTYCSIDYFKNIEKLFCSMFWIKMKIVHSFQINDANSINDTDLSTYENNFFNETMPYILFAPLIDNKIAFIDLVRKLVKTV
mgnify:CR=1 FL=1